LKIATFKIGAKRKVGVIDEGAATIAPFELSTEQAQQGIQQ
jgi:hypothetical protein